MKVINIMNFVRYIDERREGSIEYQYETTKQELELVNEFGFENTFLLQYDAVCAESYQKLFKEHATEKTELGLWYEIVEPLTSACGLPYRSENGWKWDWHIIPGFSMGYTPEEREMLIDEAMRKFKEVFGEYPKTVASWIIDTHTINHLAKNYDIDAFAICRDQKNTDAYTLIGGYFNQAYYPSAKNMFTPAKCEELRINTPIFRLLGPCPVHNYESQKYISEETRKAYGCYTLEPYALTGKTPEYVDWFFKTYYENEDLGFSYCQLGQENSFGLCILPALRMQFEKVKALKSVKVQKMCDTGREFKEKFKKTPATSVVATDNWDTEDLQSAYYDCENYTANIMRVRNKIFIRSLFLFDERIEDAYLNNVCTTFDARYENLPLINNLEWDNNSDCGLILDCDAESFTAEKLSDGILKISWGKKSVIFDEEKITVNAGAIHFCPGVPTADITVNGNEFLYNYKGNSYRLKIKGAEIKELENGKTELCTSDSCELYPTL